MGVKKVEHLDAWTRPLQVVEDADGTDTQTKDLTTSIAWDMLGRITGVTDDRGSAWIYAWDSLDRRTSVTDPDLGTWTYTHDAKGRLHRIHYGSICLYHSRFLPNLSGEDGWLEYEMRIFHESDSEYVVM